MAEINGDENDNILNGTSGADTITGDVGNDTITGGRGNDLIFGDITDPFEVPTGSSASPNINDPASFNSGAYSTTESFSGNTWDTDGNGLNEGDPGNLRITDGGNFAGDNIELKYPGGGKGDGTEQSVWLDLSTFEENFFIEVKSEDVDAEDGNPFDVDAGTQDTLILTNVVSLSNDPNDGTGTLTVVYQGSDGGNYTVDIEYNGAQVIAYGPGGQTITPDFDDVINAGAGVDTVDGGLGDDDIDLGSSNDVVISSRGNDTIEGGTGNDTYDASGDIVEGLTGVGSPSDPNLNDPNDFRAAEYGTNTTSFSGNTWDTDGDGLNDGDTGNLRITDGGNFAGDNIELKYPGGASGDGTEQSVWLDLSTFEENFNIEVKSEDVDAEDGNPFDVDAGTQDTLVLTNVVSLSNDPNDGTGTLTVVYEGSDGSNYTVDIEYNGAQIIAYGTDGGQIDEADIINSIDVTVGTTGVNDDNLANYGDGTVDKVFANSDTGTNTGTDTISNVETFIANETVIPASPASGTIAIDNASFENPSLSNGDFTTSAPPGWTLSGSGGVYDPNSGEIAGVTGENVFYTESNGTTLSQTLDHQYNADETYTFNVDLGDPDYSGAQGYTVNLYAGNTLIGTTSGSTGNNDTLQTVTVTSGAGNTGLNGQDLRIEIVDTGGSGELHVDNVTGSFVNSNPTPGGELEDRIELTGAVETTDVTGVGDGSVGFVVYNPGQPDETTVNFGGPGQPTINQLLQGTVPEARPAAFGDWTITDTNGDEDGLIGDISYENFEIVEFETICFARGTLIDTADGPMPVEAITSGTMVRTMDHGLQPVRWIHSTTVSGTGNNAPILIRKGALGNDRDLRVSPQHRMLLSGWQLELLFDQPEALVPAKMLVNDHSILRVETDQVEYFHMMFDDHEIVFAEGAPSESFHPGRMGLGTFCEDTRAELFRLFPELETQLESYGPSARQTLKAFEAKMLVDGSDMFNRA